MNEKVHIVSVISGTGSIFNKVFKNIDEALECYEYYHNIPKDQYATAESVVYLEENVEIK